MNRNILRHLEGVDYRTMAHRHGSSPEIIEQCLARLTVIIRTGPSEQAEKLATLLPLVVRVLARVDPQHALRVLPMVVYAILFIQPGNIAKIELFLPWLVCHMARSGVDPATFVSLLVSAIRECNPQPAYDKFTSSKYFPTFSSFDEVDAERQKYATQIFHDYNHLRRLLELHEATIRTRWLGYGPRKRKKIMLNSWPGMATQHRPDLLAYLQGEMWDRDSHEWQWPHINLEDLTTPKLFLILLNARGRNSPSLFSHADRESCRIGRMCFKISPILDDYTMVFRDQESVERYGQLVSWDENPLAFFWYATERELNVSEGMMTLKIQSRIYQFLLNCGLEIMHMDLDGLKYAAIFAEVKPEPPRLSTAAPGSHTLATIVAETPYRLPSQLDLDSLTILFAAKLSAAKDHIRSLREDPSYFVKVIVDVKEHSEEQIPDKKGLTHHSLRESTIEFQGRAIKEVFKSSFLELVFWDCVHSHLIRLRDLCQERSAELKSNKELPADVLQEFLVLDVILDHFSMGLRSQLQYRVPASPPLRGKFSSTSNNSMFSIEFTRKLIPQSSEGVFLKIFDLLIVNRQVGMNVGLHLLMEELERRGKRDGKTRKLLSPFVKAALSDLYLVIECRHQLRSCFPWAATFEGERRRQSAKLEEEYRLNFMEMASLLENLVLPEPLVTLGNLSNFYCPVEQRRARIVSENLQMAEENLDQFWREADPFLAELIEKSPDVLKGLLRSNPHLCLPLASPASPTPPDPIHSFSDVYFEMERRTENTVYHSQQPEKKAKMKTRGIPRIPSSSALAEDPNPDLEDTNPQPAIAVSRRAFVVFQTIFFCPSKAAQPGEVYWNDFLHVMQSAGFDTEKLHGSAWQFTPRSAEMKHGIQFHEPHPVPKLPFRTARRYGRRLHRTYGWSADTFCLDS